MVPEELRAIYALLETEFSPLDLCARVAPLLERLDALGAPLSAASPVQEASLSQYKQALKEVRAWAKIGQVAHFQAVELEAVPICPVQQGCSCHQGLGSHCSLQGWVPRRPMSCAMHETALLQQTLLCLVVATLLHSRCCADGGMRF